MTNSEETSSSTPENAMVRDLKIANEELKMWRKQWRLQEDKGDEINHPRHYTFGKFEPIDVIEDWNLGMHLGNLVKYVARAGKKDSSIPGMIKDLKKGEFYLKRKIKLLEESIHLKKPTN